MKPATWEEAFSPKNRVSVSFSSQDADKILKLTGNKLDSKTGEIVSSEGRKELSIGDGESIPLSQLGAIVSGSKIFIRNNISNFYDYLELQKK